jgi:putative transcriptional regulator
VRPWHRAALLTFSLWLPAAALGQNFPEAFLLVARPGMPDPNFRETVVLVAQDEHAQATGVIVNRPTHHSLADLLPSERFKALTDAIYFGGPVARQGLFAVFRADKVPGEAVKMLPGLYLALLPSTIDALINRPPPKIRFFAGYCGWGPGQLRGEIDRGDWLVVDADADAVFLKDTSTLWQDMLRRGRSLRADAAERAPSGRDR